MSHRQEVEQVRHEIDSQLTGLWVATKENRVAEYQQHSDDLSDLLAEEDLDPTVPARLVDKIAKLLRQVADEMNELPMRIKIETSPVPTRMVLGNDVMGESQQIISSANGSVLSKRAKDRRELSHDVR